MSINTAAPNDALRLILNKLIPPKAQDHHHPQSIDPAAAIAAASQYVSKDRVQNDESRSQDDVSYHEAVAHTINRLLVKALIVPLTSFNAERHDLLITDPQRTGINVQQALEVLQITTSSSPKFLEHLFALPQSEPGLDDTILLGPSRFRNTTFDLWVAPRMLSAAAVVASTGTPQHDVKKKLYRDILVQLSNILEASVETVNQADNVRLILAECLKAAAQALSLAGRPSFMPDTVVPSYIINRTKSQLEPQPRGGSEHTVTFFGDELCLQRFRLSCTNESSKSTGAPLVGFTPEQSAATFTIDLQSTHPDAFIVYQRSQILFLASVQLCFNVSSAFPTHFMDICQDAAMLFVSNWEYDLVSRQAHGEVKSRFWLLDAKRLDIVSEHIEFLYNLHPMVAEKIFQLVATVLVDAIETTSDHSSHDRPQGSSPAPVLEALDAALRAFGTLLNHQPLAEPTMPPSRALKRHAAILINEVIGRLSSETFEQVSQDSSAQKAFKIWDMKRTCALSALFIILSNHGKGITSGQLSLLKDFIDRKSKWDLEHPDQQDNLDNAGSVNFSWLKPLDLAQLHSALIKVTAPISDSKKRKRLDNDNGNEEIQQEKPRSDETSVNATFPPKRVSTSDETASVTLMDLEKYFIRFAANPILQSKISLKSFEQWKEAEVVVKCRYEGLSICARSRTLHQSKSLGNIALFSQVFRCQRCDGQISNVPETLGILEEDGLADGKLWLNEASNFFLQRNKLQIRAYLDTLRRILSHLPAHHILSMQQPVLVDLVRQGLKSKDKSTRLATTELALTVATKIGEARSPSMHNDSRDKLDEIVTIYRSILDCPRSEIHETAIIGLALLLRLPYEALRQPCLLCLILQLGNPNPFLKSLAYAQVVQVAADLRCTTYQLIRPYLEAISTTIVERFISMPDLWTGFLNLIKMNQQGFFNATIEYTLPHLIGMVCSEKTEEGRKMIQLIARALGSDVPKLCLVNITSIFKYFFMRMKYLRNEGFQVLLELIGIDITNMKSLLRSRQSEVVGHLVTRLGNFETRSSAYEGLEYIDMTLNDSASREKERKRQSKKTLVANFLKDEILAILTWINHELMGEHGKRSTADKTYAARSIGALVDIIGPTISAVTPQIMATLNSTLQVPDLVQATLESWKIFIKTLKFDDIGPFVGQTAAALLAAWPTFDDVTKQVAIEILEYLVVDNAEHFSSYINDIPSLDRLESEIPEISRKLRALRESWNNDKYFKNILERVSHENSTICLQSLGELKVFLIKERSYIEGLTSGHFFSSLIGDCIQTLLASATRSDAMEEEIRNLCFQCLGLAGAIDPDRFEHSSDQSQRILLHNFEDEDEAIDFVVHLIRDLLVPAFRAADDTSHQSGLAYAIQELLKFCGFSTNVLSVNSNTASKAVSLKTKQRWQDLPQETLDTISPLLDSKYMVQVGKLTVKESPIYLNTHTYREWIQGWANHLIFRVSEARQNATEDAKSLKIAATIFSVFRIAIRDQDIGIARHILPHLILHILISGQDVDRERIAQEFNTILTDQVDPKTGFDAERRLLTAQTIFGLMDHLGVWMRKKLQDISRVSRRSRTVQALEDAILRVESLTVSISQELMAQASLQCKAYARSLFNFEQRIRTLKTNASRRDCDLQAYYENLHQIYAYLDEPDGMEGISTKVISPSLEHQIREHESTGRWTSAQSCWEVELQQRPDDANLHIGLLRCLRNLGHYDTMRTQIRGALSVHPEWEPLLASFRVEGACILGDWNEVEACVSHSEGNSAQHSIGRVLLAMRNPGSEDFEKVLAEARKQMGKPIIAAGRGSYSSIYDIVLQLHMLHELEMIRSTHVGDLRTQRQLVVSLNRSLNGRLNATLPSFRTREPILSLRRTAFSAIDLNPALRSEVGNAWIATAKIARRAGHRQTAYSAMLQASQCQASFAFVQRAKLLTLEDQTHSAIQELNNSLQTLSATFKPGQLADPENLGPIIIENGSDGEPIQIDRHTFAKACLLRARYLDATFRYTPAEIDQSYKEATREKSDSEKVWYFWGHFQDTHEGLLPNSSLQRYNVCRAFLKSALHGTKFFYRTLPRVITIWMDLASEDTILDAIKRSKRGTVSDASEQVQAFMSLNTLMKKYSRRLKAFQWLAVFPQLVARIVQKNEMVWDVLVDIILHVLIAFPQQAMWSMVAGSNSKDAERKKRFNDIATKINRVSGTLKELAKIVNGSQRLAREMLKLCDYQVGKGETVLSMEQKFPGLLEVTANFDLLLPLQSSMSVQLPSNNLISDDHRPFPSNLPTIKTFDDHIEVMNSLQKPRKVMIVGSDGHRYPFLVKPKDDLRKDARLMEFDSMINKLLKSNPESRRRKLYVRTYAVLILNEEHGLIEWVPHTVGLRHILTKLYNGKGIPIYSSEIKASMDGARLNADPKETARIFSSQVLDKFPPVFHEWFVATFPEPSTWLKARSSYARTAAVMSMVGFVLGLGDRHGENILFDANSGDTVHVDLNCLFDKGHRFEIPERVPFRLTQNMVDAFGVTGYEGMFRRSAEITMGILRDNKDSLMSVLEAMVHDPLGEWTTHEERSRSKNSNRVDPRILEARRALDPVANKLDGRMYRFGKREPTPPYSTGNLVDALIKEATSPVNLSKMYVGWSSWL